MFTFFKKIQNSHRLNIQSLRDKIFKNSKRKWFKNCKWNGNVDRASLKDR